MADPKLKKVRVLTQTRHRGEVLNHGEVVEMTDAEIKAQVGAVDADPDAVEHAESLLPAPKADKA